MHDAGFPLEFQATFNLNACMWPCWDLPCPLETSYRSFSCLPGNSVCSTYKELTYIRGPLILANVLLIDHPITKSFAALPSHYESEAPRKGNKLYRCDQNYQASMGLQLTSLWLEPRSPFAIPPREKKYCFDEYLWKTLAKMNYVVSKKHSANYPSTPPSDTRQSSNSHHWIWRPPHVAITWH